MELTTWSKVLPGLFGFISYAATTCDSGEALAAALEATHQLRHTAVHRFPTCVNAIERMLQDAMNLATALQDQKRMVTLNRILMDFQWTMLQLELQKNDLESDLDGQLRDIQDQRRNLDKKEKEAKVNMLQQDLVNTATISSLFENSLKNLTWIDEYSANAAEHTDSGNVNAETSESDAVAADSSDEPCTWNEEGAADDPVSDACITASTPKDTEPSPADPSESAEQRTEIASTSLRSESDPHPLDTQSHSRTQSTEFDPST